MAECAAAKEPGFFDTVIVNDSLEDAYAQLVAWVSANVAPLA